LRKSKIRLAADFDQNPVSQSLHLKVMAERVVGPCPFQAVSKTASRLATCKVRRKNLQGLPIAGASAVVVSHFFVARLTIFWLRSLFVLPQHLPLVAQFIIEPNTALSLRNGLFSHAINLLLYY